MKTAREIADEAFEICSDNRERENIDNRITLLMMDANEIDNYVSELEAKVAERAEADKGLFN